MSMLTSLTLTVCLIWSLAACSSGPPKPVLPDGLHRVPVNRVPPVPDVPTAMPAAPELPASPAVGDRS
ncbi:hypothetical protein NUV25_13040 [Burkholderia pseudomultivorans]|uniref:hypothetical protein n=1 Tax=Burkholderia pseudomultivorans TaxID=1207504 RepID=UPI002874C653|nr:hypothetical protein [Burkholderia pseudomultivorans]MDS0858632.1 hypothetical protein [Burkholderia pseudomultivorans]